MIIDNLYATGTSISVGETTNQYRDEYTNTISQIYNTDGTVSQDAYWLGWISYDNLPIYCQHNNVVEDADKIEFVNDTVAKNCPIGYVYNGGSQVYNHVYMQNDEPFVTPANTCRFINNMHPEYSAQMVSSNFGNIWVGYNITIEDIYRAGGTIYCTDTGGLTGVLSWLNGETVRTLTFSYSGNTYTIDVDLSQMTDVYFLEIPTNEDAEIVVTFSLIQILFSGNTRYKNGTTYGNTFISPSTRILYDNGEDTGNYNCFIGSWGSTAMVGFAAYYDSIGYVRYRDVYASPLTYETRTGCTGEFLKTDITSLQDNGVLYNNNIMAYRRIVSGNNRTYFVALLSPKDIITAISLFYRVYYNAENISANPSISSYVENISWATDVNENNEFLGVLKTGNVTNSEFRNGLRTWQYTSLQYNDFTEDDIPEYEPTPGDDGTDSGGDDIRPSDWTNLRIGAANNFVTLYGMTAETVADFGQKMWASLADPAFWQMVGTAFTNDFSINPADMMKYFISLRYFPFDLADFAHTTATGVYIGRAATPIAPSTGVAYPICITNNVIQVDGGRLTIRRFYNDFRDFEPCTTVQIHVPFCGSVDVPASEIMGHEMDLTYKIDLQTGAMLAVLGVASNTYYVIATLAGTCGASIPITANNNIEFLQRIATVGSGIIGGGVSGAVKGATVGGEVGAVVGAVAGTVGGGVGALAGLPPVTVHKQGNASGFANLGGVPYAYATVQRGRFERPANYGHTTGFACDFSATLGSLSGFTVCDNVDTSGLTCNARERDEIKRLLESGVYV